MKDLRLNLCIMHTNTDGDRNCCAITRMINNAILNDGQTIYNGNDEQIVVPCIRDMRQLHASTWTAYEVNDPDAEFDGWADMAEAKALVFANFANCTDKRDELLRALLQPETYEMFDQHRADFDNIDTAAIVVTLTDGSFFEYVVTETQEVE